MSISKRMRFEVFKRDNFTCQYCGARPPDTVLEVDHIHPRCEGGRDEMSNLRTACWACNRGKGPIPLIDLCTFELFGGGPIDGSYTFKRSKGPLPALWVATDDTGVIVAFEDERNDYESDEWKEDHKLFVVGHPSNHISENPDGSPKPGWYFDSMEADQHPRTIGIYCDLQVPRPAGVLPKKLCYMSADWLLQELCW